MYSIFITDFPYCGEIHMKLTRLKCMVQEMTAFLLLCNLHTDSRMCSSPQTGALLPVTVHLPLSPATMHCFLSLWICLFWICPMQGITQDVTSCVWLFSKHVFQVRSCHNIYQPYSFSWPHNIPLHGYASCCFPIHLLTGIWVVSTF